MLPANAIVDYILRKGPNDQHGLPTQLTLMKLVYFVEGWALALLGCSIVQEQIYAWRRGPVVKSQRQRLKSFGSNPVPASIVSGHPETILSRDERELIDEVWRKYAGAAPSAHRMEGLGKRG